jgi:hypothetical protein
VKGLQNPVVVIAFGNALTAELNGDLPNHRLQARGTGVGRNLFWDSDHTDG